jgi:RNA recognition motif-containing protein
MFICFADDLREYFKKFGNVLDVSIKYDAVSGNPRGFGFITFGNEDAIEEVFTFHTIIEFYLRFDSDIEKRSAYHQREDYGSQESKVSSDLQKDFCRRN